MRKEETFPVAVLSGAKMKLVLFGIASRMIKCYELYKEIYGDFYFFTLIFNSLNFKVKKKNISFLTLSRNNWAAIPNKQFLRIIWGFSWHCQIFESYRD